MSSKRKLKRKNQCRNAHKLFWHDKKREIREMFVRVLEEATDEYVTHRKLFGKSVLERLIEINCNIYSDCSPTNLEMEETIND